MSWDAMEELPPKFSGVPCLAFSPDGKSIAAGSADGAVRIWDAAEGKKKIATLKPNPDGVIALAYKPDGKMLAAVGPSTTSATVLLWDLATGIVIQKIETRQSGLPCIAFGPDGKTLASASIVIPAGGNSIKLWEIPTGNHIATIPDAQKFGVKCIAFAPDGKTLASSGIDFSETKPAKNPPPPKLDSQWHDGEIKLWNVMTLKHTATFKGHTQTVNSIAISPDGKLLASGSKDKTVKLWDMATGTCIATLSGHTEAVLTVAISPDGKMLASGSGDKTIKLWDVGPAKGK
ncbi:MAG TPA: WD40 repeat domain-containing protein [Gemmataceae bacterium]|nr:WD40 repeat domain-containing protein [Gemmataceae bacterium]